jgi:hypothetical protein
MKNNNKTNKIQDKKIEYRKSKERSRNAIESCKRSSLKVNSCLPEYITRCDQIP